MENNINRLKNSLESDVETLTKREWFQSKKEKLEAKSKYYRSLVEFLFKII